MNLGAIMVSFGSSISGFTGGVSSMISSLNALDSRLSSAKSSYASFSGSFGGISGAMSGIRKNVGDAAGGIQDFAGKAFMAGKVVGEAVFYWKDLIGSAAGLVTNLFDQNAAMEQTRIGFVGLLGGAKQADAMMSKLQAFAAATPFEFPQLAKDAQLLVGMGTKASDLIPVLTAVGDATSGVGAGADGVQRVVVALGQMNAAGKVNAQDMMQITSTGIPAWKMLASSMHLTVPEVMALSSKGLIPAAEGVKALTTGMEKMYGGQMANQAQTFNGLVSTLHDNIGAAYRAFVGPAFDMAKGGLNQLTTLMGSPKILEFATNMGKIVGGGLAQFVSFVKDNVIPAVMSFISWLGQLWTKISASGLPAIINSFKQLGATILDIVDMSGIAQFFQNAFGGNSKSLIDSINSSMLALAGFISGVANKLTGFAVAMTEPTVKGEALRLLLLGLGVAIAAFKIGTFIATIPALVGAFIAWAGAAWTAAAGTIAATWPLLLVAAIIGVVVIAIVLAVQHWGAITAWLSGVWNNFTSGAGKSFNQLGTEVRGIADNLGGMFKGLGDKAGQAKNAVGNSFGGMRDTVGSRMNDMGTAVNQGGQNMSATLMSAWNRITGDSATSWSQVGDTIRTSLGMVWGVIQGWGSNVISTISNAWNTVVTIIQGCAGAIINALTGPFNAAYNMISGILGNIGSAVSGTLGWIGGLISNVQSGLAGIHVPGFAGGVTNFAGGIAVVGEEGPEILYLPQGSSVSPINSTGNALPAPTGGSNNTSSGTVTYILQVDGRELTRALGSGMADEIRLQLQAGR